MTQTNKARAKALDWYCSTEHKVGDMPIVTAIDIALAEQQKQHEEEMSRILFGNECLDICPEIQKLKDRIKEMEK